MKNKLAGKGEGEGASRQKMEGFVFVMQKPVGPEK